ncbi:hypothetical protein [Streptomyces cyaneofuscatus]
MTNAGDHLVVAILVPEGDRHDASRAAEGVVAMLGVPEDDRHANTEGAR